MLMKLTPGMSNWRPYYLPNAAQSDFLIPYKVCNFFDLKKFKQILK
jgi:hypothetical protein